MAAMSMLPGPGDGGTGKTVLALEKARCLKGLEKPVIVLLEFEG